MFVGHTALALAAKARTPGTSLGWLFAAAMLLDLLWPPFLLMGVEHVRVEPGNTAFTNLAFDWYPWSHSLLLVLIWAALFSRFVARRAINPPARILTAALVVSHWVLDVISHRPDMPLWPRPTPLIGLGLWNSIPATLLVEGTLFAAGLAVYLRSTRATSATGVWALAGFVTVQVVMWASQPWSPPPPGAGFVAWLSLGLWLFVGWAYWLDSHRAARITSDT